VETSRRYYISSLGLDAGRAARSIRAHWQIENSLHCCLDVVFNEDQRQIFRLTGMARTGYLFSCSNFRSSGSTYLIQNWNYSGFDGCTSAETADFVQEFAPKMSSSDHGIHKTGGRRILASGSHIASSALIGVAGWALSARKRA
jgi:hypothetical protein